MQKEKMLKMGVEPQKIRLLGRATFRLRLYTAHQKLISHFEWDIPLIPLWLGKLVIPPKKGNHILRSTVVARVVAPPRTLIGGQPHRNLASLTNRPSQFTKY